MLFAGLDGDSSAAQISCYMGVLGAGIGLTNQIMILVAQDAVPAADLGVATSAVTFLRSLGGTVGVAAFGAIVDAHVRGSAPVDPSLLGTPEELRRLPTEIGDAVRAGFVDGAHAGFLLGISLAAVALACIAALRDLSDRSGVRSGVRAGDVGGGQPSGSKICSIGRSNSRAILNASGRLGSYLPVSKALTVCRETSSRSARAPWVHPLASRNARRQFFTRGGRPRSR